MRALRLVCSTLFAAVCIGIAAVMLLPVLFGLQRYVITSGSMTGTYDTGSIVYAKVVPTTTLAVGDVITYAPPAGKSPTKLVTHRIVRIGRNARTGERVLRTKGDANPTVDPWTFSLPQATQAKVSFGVPYLGYAFAALAVREVRMLVIGLPAALIALLVLAGMVREAAAERRTARLQVA